MLTKIAKILLQLSVTGLLFFYILSRVEYQDFHAAFMVIDIRYLVLATAMMLLVFLPAAVAQNVIFRSLGVLVPLRDVYAVNLISMFYSLILPGDIGAALSRIFHFTRRHRGSKDIKVKSSVFVGMAADRLLNMGVLIVPLPLLLLVFPLPVYQEVLLKTSFLSVLAFTAVLFFFYRVPLARFIPSLPSKVGQWFRRVFVDFLDVFQSITPKAMTTSFFIDLLHQGLAIFVVEYLLFVACGIHLPFATVISVILIIRFLRLIPITLSGLGIREGLYPFFLAYYGVPHEKALLLGIVGSLMMIFLGLLGGALQMIWGRSHPVLEATTD